MPKHCFTFPMKIRNLSVYCILTEYFSVVSCSHLRYHPSQACPWWINTNEVTCQECGSFSTHQSRIKLVFNWSGLQNGPLALTQATHCNKTWAFWTCHILLFPHFPKHHGLSHTNWWDTFRQNMPLSLAQIFLLCSCFSMRSPICMF